MRRQTRSHYRVAIVGAGLAGLSLARALARTSGSNDVVLLDAKRTFADDRTWSFWDVDGMGAALGARATWTRWRLTDASGAYEQCAPATPYVSIKSDAFYATALAEARAAGYDVALGERIVAIEDGRDRARVRLARSELTADVVFDARGLTPSMVGTAAVVQRFVGYRVTTERDLFDPAVATLMDVQPDVADGFHFMYVLPLGPREALVENTYFARRPIAADRLEAELAAYVRGMLGAVPWTASYCERGAIPMSSSLELPSAGHRVVPIGLRGGCARPGSGYTFHRVQAQAAAIAARLASADVSDMRDFPAMSAPACDAVLLAAARYAPALLPRAFRRLFATTGGERLARFMMDRAGPLESAPIVWASALGAAETPFHRSPSSVPARILATR